AAGIALGVLVGRHGTDRLEDARPREVLRSDQLDLPALPVGLAPEQLGDLGIDLREAGRPQLVEGLLRHGHAPGTLEAQPVSAARTRESASAAGAAPSRSTCGSASVKSITVEAVPGSRPASTSAAHSERIRPGTSSRVAGSAPPGSFALVARMQPAASTT